jgi:hypothetical protein
MKPHLQKDDLELGVYQLTGRGEERLEQIIK